MKKVICMLVCGIIFSVSGADFNSLLKEAKAAAKVKNTELVNQKYSEAYQAAVKTSDKENIIHSWCNYLRSVKLFDRARDIYEAELAKDFYNDSQRQYFLYRIAFMYIWHPKQHGYALEKVKLALSLKNADKSGVVYYALCNYAANIYSHWYKDYESIISIAEEGLKHCKASSHRSSLHSWLGLSYKKLEQKELAIENYKQALKYGKQAKINIAKIEKELKELEK